MKNADINNMEKIDKNNCECNKCKCERCGKKRMFQDKRTVVLNPGHYKHYDVWRCLECNYQWSEPLEEINLKKSEITEEKA